jgi:hypothetical protein
MPPLCEVDEHPGLWLAAATPIIVIVRAHYHLLERKSGSQDPRHFIQIPRVEESSRYIRLIACDKDIKPQFVQPTHNARRIPVESKVFDPARSHANTIPKDKLIENAVAIEEHRGPHTASFVATASNE